MAKVPYEFLTTSIDTDPNRASPLISNLSGSQLDKNIHPLLQASKRDGSGSNHLNQQQVSVSNLATAIVIQPPSIIDKANFSSPSISFPPSLAQPGDTYLPRKCTVCGFDNTCTTCNGMGWCKSKSCVICSALAGEDDEIGELVTQGCPGVDSTSGLVSRCHQGHVWIRCIDCDAKGETRCLNVKCKKGWYNLSKRGVENNMLAVARIGRTID